MFHNCQQSTNVDAGDDIRRRGKKHLPYGNIHYQIEKEASFHIAKFFSLIAVFAIHYRTNFNQTNYQLLLHISIQPSNHGIYTTEASSTKLGEMGERSGKTWRQKAECTHEGTFSIRFKCQRGGLPDSKSIQPPIGKNANAVRDLGLGGYFDEATNWANNSAPFAQFLAGVESSVDPGAGDMGIFEILHAQQVELRNLLARGYGEDTGLNAVNEELVNSSLINFLTAISITHPKVQASWTPHRATITAELKRAKLSCQIDGYLFSKTTPSETQILLGAKSEERLKHEPYVPTSPCRRRMKSWLLWRLVPLRVFRRTGKSMLFCFS